MLYYKGDTIYQTSEKPLAGWTRLEEQNFYSNRYRFAKLYRNQTLELIVYCTTQGLTRRLQYLVQCNGPCKVKFTLYPNGVLAELDYDAKAEPGAYYATVCYDNVSAVAQEAMSNLGLS